MNVFFCSPGGNPVFPQFFPYIQCGDHRQSRVLNLGSLGLAMMLDSALGGGREGGRAAQSRHEWVDEQ